MFHILRQKNVIFFLKIIQFFGKVTFQQWQKNNPKLQLLSIVLYNQGSVLCPDFSPSFPSLVSELDASFPFSLTALCCSCPAFFLSDCCSLRLPLPLLHLPHFCLYKEALLALWEKPPTLSLLLTSKKSTRALLTLPFAPPLSSFALSSALSYYLPLLG